MNFSGISYSSFLGKVLRSPLKLIPDGMVLPILQGRLRGKKWIVGSSNHGCWLGSYEFHKQRLLSRWIRPADTVFDIGAHVGFYTLLCSELVGATGKVVAFEPLPRNLFYLYEHLRLNQCDNVSVIEAAVADYCGKAYFDDTYTHSMGRLSSSGRLCVNTVSLDTLMTDKDLPNPRLLKIDIEGGELHALLGAKSLLTVHLPTILLATHGRDNQRKCCSFLQSLGYQLKPLAGKHGSTIDTTDEILAYVD